MATVNLKSAEFRRERETAWRALEGMLERIEKGGVRALTAAELMALPMLYRTAASSLSVARAISLDRNLTAYLEQLVLRAHTAIHAPRQRFLETVGFYVFDELPRVVRSAGAYILAGWLIMMVGGFIGWRLIAMDPEMFRDLVPAHFADAHEFDPSDPNDLPAPLDTSGSEQSAEELLTFSAFLMVHNIKVGLLSFVTGIALGIPTLLMGLYNGIILGAFLAWYHSHGLLLPFVAWLSIHGVTELTAISLALAAGLMLAEAVVFPGQLSRRAALVKRGQDAAVLMLGAMLMLVIAGVIEGMFRQTVTDTTQRFAIAAGTAVFWTLYFATPPSLKRRRAR